MRRTQTGGGGLFLTAAAACFVLALVFQVPLLAGPRAAVHGLVTPLESVAVEIESAASRPAALLGDIAGLRAENSRLITDNRALRRQVAELSAAGRENDDLRRALAFQRSFGHRLVAASVVGRGPDAFSRTLTIDRGSADGLREGMVVVTGAGLVGRLREVGPRSAAIETVADPSSRVNVYTVGSNLDGTVSGGAGPLRMEIPARPGAVVQPGEWVLSSGIGGLYPRGIVVGQVLRFDRRDTAPVEVASLAWANDLASLSTVLVVQDFQPSPVPR